MKQTITFILLLICGAAIAQPTLADTTKIHVFDRTNSWFTTGALLKTYVTAGGGGDFIPLAGTDTGVPVTGAIEFEGNDGSIGTKNILTGTDAFGGTFSILSTDEGIFGMNLASTSSGVTSSVYFSANDVQFLSTDGSNLSSVVLNPVGGMSVFSNTGALIPPRITSAQKEAQTPSEGWEVWDTDLDGKCVYDGVKWLRLSQKSAPSIAVGAGAGTGATVTVVGNDIEGVITLTGGTGATASATVFTLTFFDSYTTAPHGVIITPADADAANLPAGRIPAFDTVSTTTFTMINASVNGITNAVVYKYAYRVIQ